MSAKGQADGQHELYNNCSVIHSKYAAVKPEPRLRSNVQCPRPDVRRPRSDARPHSYNAAMSGSPAVYSPESMRAEKRAVAGNSVLAALAITTLKIIVGVTTGSLGILSEALHSVLDLVAAIITLHVGAGI